MAITSCSCSQDKANLDIRFAVKLPPEAQNDPPNDSHVIMPLGIILPPSDDIMVTSPPLTKYDDHESYAKLYFIVTHRWCTPLYIKITVFATNLVDGAEYPIFEDSLENVPSCEDAYWSWDGFGNLDNFVNEAATQEQVSQEYSNDCFNTKFLKSHKLKIVLKPYTDPAFSNLLKEHICTKYLKITHIRDAKRILKKEKSKGVDWADIIVKRKGTEYEAKVIMRLQINPSINSEFRQAVNRNEADLTLLCKKGIEYHWRRFGNDSSLNTSLQSDPAVQKNLTHGKGVEHYPIGTPAPRLPDLRVDAAWPPEFKKTTTSPKNSKIKAWVEVEESPKSSLKIRVESTDNPDARSRSIANPIIYYKVATLVKSGLSSEYFNADIFCMDDAAHEVGHMVLYAAYPSDFWYSGAHMGTSSHELQEVNNDSPSYAVSLAIAGPVELNLMYYYTGFLLASNMYMRKFHNNDFRALISLCGVYASWGGK